MIDKVAYYKKEIYKTAARAWKKHLGDIGEEGINKIVNSGILNRKKELEGLSLGTKNIRKAHNIDKVTDSGEAATRAVDALIGEGLWPANSDRKSLANMFKKRKGSAYGQPLGKDKFVFIEDDIGDKMYDLYNIRINLDFPKIPRQDKASNDWVQSLIERHETDEIRFRDKLVKTKNGIDDSGYSRARFSSHISPKVLGTESANLAVAPGNAKNFMTNLRSLDAIQEPEVQQLKNLTGIDYGKSGVYDRVASKKAEKRMIGKTIEEERDPVW